MIPSSHSTPDGIDAPATGMRNRTSANPNGSISSIQYNDQQQHTSSLPVYTPMDIQQMEEQSGQAQMMQLIPDQNYLQERADAMEAVEMLLRLSGRTHSVLTGWALVVPGSDRLVAGVVESRVTMRVLSRDEAHGYAATGEPLDKAGAYAVQGIGARHPSRPSGSHAISFVRGSISTVSPQTTGTAASHISPSQMAADPHPSMSAQSTEPSARG